jgi:hypothetical protein
MKNKVPTNANSASSSDDEEELMEVDKVHEVSDAESLQLIGEFKTNIPAFEEYTMEFVSSKIGHPVVSCFRELSGIDVNFIISNVVSINKRIF